MRDFETGLTLDRLKSFLNYNPDTGAWTWLVARGTALKGSAAGRENGGGYIIICIDGHNYRAHRLAWLYMTGEWPSKFIDHKNRARADNHWSNLRQATRSENNRNRACLSKTKFKGVEIAASGKFRARIRQLDGKTKNIGTFDKPEDAAAAYFAVAKSICGEFARVA